MDRESKRKSGDRLLAQAMAAPGRIVALTGAGISAESGIPTFRGEEGYWTVGSRVYQPLELATQATFRSNPGAVWPWYLHRRRICRAAAPNPAHHALVRLEKALGPRFVLVTQNVDGLHLRAGSSREATWQIHGNIDYMRCAAGCRGLVAVPDDTPWEELRCASCARPARPHVLWFDEYYDEELYRFESSLRAAAEASLLLIVGTAGATNLPNQMVEVAVRQGAVVVDINPSDNPFGAIARRYHRGVEVRGTAGECLPAIADALLAAA